MNRTSPQRENHMNHTTEECAPEHTRDALAALADVEQKTQRPQLWGTVPMGLLTAVAVFSLLLHNWWLLGVIFAILCAVGALAARKDRTGVRENIPDDHFPKARRAEKLWWLYSLILFIAVGIVDFPSEPRPQWVWATFGLVSFAGGALMALWYRDTMIGSWENREGES